MEVGSILGGKYRLEALLGRGGMGSVWRATHLGLHAPVAVKLIDQQIVMNPDAIARFHREARAAAGLRSPHVVQILDHGVDEATQIPFIAMELMEGESLAQRLQRIRCLPPQETARVISHVARALSRAHDGGIVHRDLKPDNIFLVRNEDEEIAKVLDFGIAKAQGTLGTDSATRTGAVMGTPYYMSPEQISGAKNVDFRTDLWALGVIACECLTGVRPFDAESIGGLTLKICVEPLPRPSALGPVPPAFDAWFERAVARQAPARFASARELAEELRKVCGAEASLGLQAYQPPPGAITSNAAVATSAPSMGALTRSSSDDVPAGVRRGKTGLALALTGLLFVAGGAAGAWVLLKPGASEPVVAGESAAPQVPAAPATEAAPATTAAPATPRPVEVTPADAPVAVTPAPAASVAPAASALPVAVAPVRPAPKVTPKVVAKATAAPAVEAAPVATAPAPTATAVAKPKPTLDARSVINSRR